MRKRWLFLMGWLLLVYNDVCGQAEKIDSVLRVYHERYVPEKVALQFDRKVYAAGETIWFKAYLFSGSQPSVVGKNLYVDLFDPMGRLLKHFVAPVWMGSAKGQVEVPADYRGAFVHVRAYTQWMLNFDDAFIYTRDLVVLGGARLGGVSAAGAAPARDQVSAPGGRQAAAPGQAEIAAPGRASVALRFFPEGGDMVEGLGSQLAFSAADGAGRPVDMSGGIYSGKGLLVDSFSSRHDGMGSLSFTPQAGENYLARWQDSRGQRHETALPAALKSGVVLYAQALPKRTMVQVSRSPDAGDNYKMLHLAVYMNQRLVYRSLLNLSVKTAGIAEIPTDSLPPGILQITVFDALLVPVTERIVFVNNHNYEFITDMNVRQKGLGVREKNIIELSSPDTAAANLSVAVVDADRMADRNTIISQLLLCGDIRGYINEPSYYFGGDDLTTRQDLDLVMLTHGWRKFDWGNAFRGITPPLPYGRDSDYVLIKGKTALDPNVHVPAGQQLALVLMAKDSTRQLVTVPVEKDGSFVLHGAVFFDTMRVYYQYIGERKLDRVTGLVFQNGFLSPQAAFGPGSYRPPAAGRAADYASPWLGIDSGEEKGEVRFAAKKADVEKMIKGKTLQDVIVTAKARSAVDLLDDKYTSGFFRGDGSDVAKQFDLANDNRANGMSSVFQYLQGMVPGLQISRKSDGTGWSLQWRGGSPDLFVDEVHTDAIQLDNVPIQDVAYIKVFRPPFFGSSAGTGGAIAIYMKKGTDVKPTTVDEAALSYKTLEGYSPVKKFYSPDYSVPVDPVADKRATLYWKPYVLIDAHSRKATIEFYNNDLSRRLRVIVEGVNADGKLTRTEKLIE